MENRLSEISENDLKRVCSGRDVKAEYREDGHGSAGYDIVVTGGHGLSLWQSSSARRQAAFMKHETQLGRLVGYFVGRAVHKLTQELSIHDKCNSAYSPRSRAGKAERWR